MKKIITPRFVFICRVTKTLMFLLLFSANGIAQTFYTETFDGTACAATSGCDPSLVSWTTTNIGAQGGAANMFYVSCTENGNAAGVCGSGCGSDQSLHVGNVSTSSAAAFWCPTGDCGASFDDSSPTEATNKRAESPTINCSGQSNITIAFNYIEQGGSTVDPQDDASLWYFDGISWTVINALTPTVNGACSPQGKWTAFSMLLPSSADGNPNVKIGFVWTNDGDGVASDPSFAVDDITLTSAATSNTITTGTITGSPFCACSTVNVPFTSTGTFTAGNIYTAQLSNAAGSFATPVAIGTLASTANTGTISATIPCGTPTGTGYRIRVISSAPVITGTDNGVNIIVNAPPVATFSYTGTPYCSTGTDPSPTYSGGGVAGTYTSTAGLTFISTSTGQVDLSASTPGTYTVTNTIAASGGCAAVSATSSITINAPAVATFSYIGTPYCSTSTDPSPTFSGGGVAGTFTSAAGLTFISASTGQVDLSASTPGTYTVTNTIAASGGCAAVTATSSITINSPAVATFSYTGTPYCADAADPSPTFSGGGVAGIFTSAAGLTFISASTGQVDLSASTPGTYTVTNTIAASGGCTAITATSSITINPVQSSAFNYSGGTFCQSGTDPIPTITGTSGGTFTSSPAGLSFVSTSTGEIDLSLSSLNTYTVTYTTPGPCATSSIASVTISALPAATFSYTGTPYCADEADPSPTFSGGGSAGTFTSSAGLTFVSAASGEVDLSASTAGTYTVTNTIAASGGCPASSATSTIVINAVQDSSFSYSGSTFCQSGANPTPTITGTSGGTFTSSPAGLVFVSAGTGEIDLASSTLGTYSVTYTTPGPCASSLAVSVTITTSPVATFSYTGTPYCADEADPSPTFSGGGSAGTFTSSAGLTFVSAATGEVDLSASTAGTYTVTNTIAASGGCPASSATSTIVINAVQDSSFSYSGSTFCQSGTNPTPTITGTSGGTFTSSPAGLVFVSAGTGEIDLSGSTAGTYSITYTTPGPCASSLSVSVTITEPQTATFSYTGTPYCQNDPNPSPTLTGGSIAGTFSSSAGLTFVSASTGQVNLSGSTPGTYTVTNTIAATGGCPAVTETSSITINPNQDSTFTYSSGSYCQSGTNPTPTITGTSGGTFTSSPAGLVFVSASTGEIGLSGSTAGTYSITYTTPGPCASSSSVSVTITEPQTATFSYTGTPYCQNDPNPSPTLTGGSIAGTFSSSAGLTFVSASTGQVNLSGSTPGTYTVTNTIAATGGCPAVTETSDITINETPTVTVNSATICDGETATLTASGADTYTWSAGVTASGATATASPAATTSYTVTGTTAGCSNTAVAIVTVNDCNKPEANFSGTPTVMCEAGCVNFTDLSTNIPTSWSWSFPGATPSSSTDQNPSNICYSANGSYDVTLIATNSSGSDTLTMAGYITVGAPVQVEITGNLLVTSCEETVLTAVPSDGTYTWGPSGTLSATSGATVTAAPTETQDYYVNYTSEEGCTDSDTVTVVVEDINTYFLPTGLTPNGDGINDEVHLHGRGIDYFTLKIFDRIGEKVFETGDIEKGWDGKLLGVPMNNGVFVFVLDITFCNGENVKAHGDITLVK